MQATITKTEAETNVELSNGKSVYSVQIFYNGVVYVWHRRVTARRALWVRVKSDTPLAARLIEAAKVAAA